MLSPHHTISADEPPICGAFTTKGLGDAASSGRTGLPVPERIPCQIRLWGLPPARSRHMVRLLNPEAGTMANSRGASGHVPPDRQIGAPGVPGSPRPRDGGGVSLVDVLDRVLDKGIVIDAHVAFDVSGLRLATVDARVVVASIETYLEMADIISRTGLAAPPRGFVGPGRPPEVGPLPPGPTLPRSFEELWIDRQERSDRRPPWPPEDPERG